MAGLRRRGQEYVAGVRVVTLVPVVTVALLVRDGARQPAVVLVAVTVVVIWSAAYVPVLIHGPGIWLTLTDAVVLTALALTIPWSVPPEWTADGKSWLLPFLAFACVGYQYSASVLVGGIAAAVVLAGAITGSLLAIAPGGKTGGAVTAVWSVVVAILARVLWMLVTRAGLRADQDAAEAEVARSKHEQAARVRDDEIEHNRRLHDTAAATLLMVGIGSASRTPGLLAAQAKRDLVALRSWEDAVPTSTNLLEELRKASEYTDLTVTLHASGEVILSPHVVRALADAATEAFTNTINHSGVRACCVTVRSTTRRVQVTIADAGKGFDPDAPRAGGWGLRGSIVDRVRAVGGTAEVRSAPGHGTRVVLDWPQP